MQTDDIAEWLTQVWDDEERRAKAQSHWADGWLEPAPRSGPSHGYVGAPVRPTTDQIVARITADRQILALHQPESADSLFCITCAGQVIAGDLEADPWPCATVRLLALPYADRPGYREDWRP